MVTADASARAGDWYGVERARMTGDGPSAGYTIREFTTPERLNLAGGVEVTDQNPVRE